jgi:hypothetical protein
LRLLGSTSDISDGICTLRFDRLAFSVSVAVFASSVGQPVCLNDLDLLHTASWFLMVSPHPSHAADIV